MKITQFTIIKSVIFLIILGYISLAPNNTNLSKVDAFLVLVLSVFIIIRSRKNLPLTVMFIFILYVNYSIVIGEYFVGGYLSVPFTEVKTEEIYGLTIRVMLLFISVIALFYNGKKFDVINDKLKLRDNWILFYLAICALIFALIIGVDRGDYESYGVRISPIFEYGKILFLFAFFYSGELKVRKLIIIFLIVIYILQDALYGGRVTSLQLIIFLAVTIFSNKLSLIKILICSFLGIGLLSTVGFYRNSYELTGFSIISLINNLINNYFVFDTATYAYYASATHVAAAESVDILIRLQSLYQFTISIFLGSQDISSDVTSFVVSLGFFNMGGGVMPTHFYFWLGWSGVIIIGFIVVFLINNLKYNSVYQHLLLLGIIINVPRWYLYSPNQFFRGVLFLVTILFLVFGILREQTIKRRLLK